MIKVWIAGSNGQIGRALNDILDPLEIEVLNTDLDDLDITNTDIEKFAEAEHLTAHANSIKVRFEK